MICILEVVSTFSFSIVSILLHEICHARDYGPPSNFETPRPLVYFNHFINKNAYIVIYKLEIVFTIVAPAFDILFIGCVLNSKTAYTTAEKLTFEAFLLTFKCCKDKMARLDGDETNANS